MRLVAAAAATSHEVLETERALAEARNAQRAWAQIAVCERVRVIRGIRDRLAAQANRFTDLFEPALSRTRAEALTCEIIPLAEACRFLEKKAERILGPRRVSSSGRPGWLRRVRVELLREPLGVVLVIGPSNYPLFLAAVQCVQALAAGNGVLIKPGRGGGRVLQAFRDLTLESGVPPGLFCVLEENIETGIAAIRRGVDKIVMTGSVNAGRAVLAEAADTITPCVVELSGDDPVFILDGADLTRAAKAIAFGIGLNGGDTCIVPKRVFVIEKYKAQFEGLLSSCLGRDAVPLIAVSDEQEALELAAESEYALGAVVFGEPSRARNFAARIAAGVVVINDVIVPTADPRVPFGGRRLSGFGTTRGEAGLLELTAVKAVVIQNARRLWHLQEQPGNAQELFLAFLAAAHRQGWQTRVRGLGALVRAVARNRGKKS